MIFKAGNYYRNKKTTYVVYVDILDIPIMGKKTILINEYGTTQMLEENEVNEPKPHWKEVDFRTWENAVKRANKAMEQYK